MPGSKPGFPLASNFGPPPRQALARTALESRGLKTSTSLTPQAGLAPHPHRKPLQARAGGPGSLGSAMGQRHTVGPGGHQSWDARGGQLWMSSCDSKLPREGGRRGKAPQGWGRCQPGRRGAHFHHGLHSVPHADHTALPATPCCGPCGPRDEPGARCPKTPTAVLAGAPAPVPARVPGRGEPRLALGRCRGQSPLRQHAPGDGEHRFCRRLLELQSFNLPLPYVCVSCITAGRHRWENFPLLPIVKELHDPSALDSLAGHGTDAST